MRVTSRCMMENWVPQLSEDLRHWLYLPRETLSFVGSPRRSQPIWHNYVFFSDPQQMNILQNPSQIWGDSFQWVPQNLRPSKFYIFCLFPGDSLIYKLGKRLRSKNKYCMATPRLPVPPGRLKRCWRGKTGEAKRGFCFVFCLPVLFSLNF